MDYARIYSEFIADRRLKESALTRPFERHHILPRCAGGSDNASNLIRLSPQDHLFAHALLAKIHGGVLWRAFFGMLSRRSRKYEGRRSRILYEMARREHSELVSRVVREANARRGHGARLGKKHTEESKAKMRAALAKVDRSVGPGDARYDRFVEAARKPRSAEHKAKVGAANRGRTHSEETRRKVSEAAKARGPRDPEIIEQVASKLRGRERSEETKSRMREGCKKRAPPSAETRAKISAGLLRRRALA